MTRELLPIVGEGYGDFWRFRGRYRVVKGSRGSKKSKTAALWFIVHLTRYPAANLLVVRRVLGTLKDSCWAELKWAAGRLGVSDQWRFSQSPLEATHVRTGQKIFFRGLDAPMKINSISVTVGQLCWLWVEEAFELPREADFDMLDEAIRGKNAEELFKQVTLTFNPWDERHWLKTRFFDPAPVPEVLAMTVDYRINEFLDGRDLALFVEMAQRNPRRYQVAGLGQWGVHEGLIFENWRQERFDRAEILGRAGVAPVFGLDFGFTNDPTALFCGALDRENQTLYVWDEMYERGLSNMAIFRAVSEMGAGREVIRADSAEPKSIEELRRLGLTKIRGVKKGPDSVRFGISALQDYEIVIHPKCGHFIREISAYVWDQDGVTGAGINRPAGRCEDHLMDAMRYAMEGVLGGVRFSFG
ncbi:MAG: PBSX family phage terminase large subunit [Oscillospiraceae bacterium]|nr:PBSX family phage terminase large subunit [Oscillospiraceae bacterium]